MQTATNPIRSLRQQATRLEAAITVSLSDPTRKAVHELRSETRRIEAQLDLLRRMRGLPAYRAAAEKLERRLRKLRRLAGEVRDCDVQRRLLKKPGELDAQNEARSESPAELRDDKEKLRKLLRRRRRRAESRLLHSLERQRTRIARDLETVLEAVKSHEDAAVEAEDLLKPIERRIARSSGFHQADEKRLHNLRKAAKRARYQCEAIPGEHAAALAKQLEEMQDAGGAWHDLLMLAEYGATKLGADHPLARVLERNRDERLDLYLEKLEGLRRMHPTAARAAAKVPRKGVQAARAGAAGKMGKMDKMAA
jgi:CHAD domain-containing protein